VPARVEPPGTAEPAAASMSAVVDEAKTETQANAMSAHHTGTSETVGSEGAMDGAPVRDELPAVPDEVDQNSAAVAEVERKEAERLKALEDVMLQHQEETHGYVEQIDALQAKLQYLSREATDSARKAVQAAPAGSVEKKVAEKDLQIAQLMEEGKTLAATEQKHRLIIKKLRSRITEMEKEATDAHISRAKTDTEAEALRRKAKRAEDLEKSRDDLQRRLDQVQKELNGARSDASAKTTLISELQVQLRRETQQAEALAAKVNDEARDQGRRRIAELEESVAALQLEKSLVADRGKQQVNDWKEKAERASERARMVELELKAELQVMESKLEATRARAEEASSGAVGDSQAKLLRQVETLQSQYSIASDNWQGIEATLLARVANLEKERDEAQQRESDMRRKAREAVSITAICTSDGLEFL
jgi:hypothetical protein